MSQGLAAVIDDYVANQQKSVEDARRRMDLHLKPKLGHRRMVSVTTPDIRAYVTERLEEKASRASINRELALLKRAYSLAMEDDILDSRPHIPMLAEQNTRKGFFEREDFDNVVKRLPHQVWRDLFTAAYCTGWRIPSELMLLTWAQVERQAHELRLEPDTTKSGEGRTFPYGKDPLLAELVARRWQERKARHILTPHVFCWEDGSPIGEGWREAWRAATKAAGVPGRIPHDLRRTAVRNLVRAGVPEKTAMLLTGHKTRSVFDRYDIVATSDLEAAVERAAEARTVTATLTAPKARQTRPARNSQRV